MKSKMAVFIAAGLLASSMVSIAQAAMNLDPNLAPSTIAEEMDITHTAAMGPELASDPDPNLGSTTVLEGARVRDVDKGAPELAMAPDPNLAVSTIN